MVRTRFGARATSALDRCSLLAVVIVLAACTSSGLEQPDNATALGQTPLESPGPTTPGPEAEADLLPTTGVAPNQHSQSRFGGRLTTAGSCWYLTTESDQAPMIFPSGFESAASGDAVVTADGILLRHGVDVTGWARMASGDDENIESAWLDYLDTCANELEFTVISTELVPAYRPSASEAAAAIASLDGADFTRDAGCGSSFAAATADQHVVLRIGAEFGKPATRVELPDPRFRAAIEIGNLLLIDYCDDSIDWFEPDPFVSATYQVVGGHVDFPDTLDRPGCDTETIVITDLIVETPNGDQHFDQPIEITSNLFGCLPG